MAHTLAPGVIPAKAAHVGPNVKITSFSGLEWSGSQTYTICALPAGAEVLDASITIAGRPLSYTVAGYFALFSTLPGIGPIIPTASASNLLNTFGSGYGTAGHLDGLGKRHSASANLYFQVISGESTAPASLSVRTIVSYLTEQRGD